MTNDAKHQYLEEIRPRYHKANRKEKKAILDEFCATCGYHRKYAIRLLNQSPRSKAKATLKRGPKSQYDDPMILEILKYFWRRTNLPCSKRLKVILQLWLPFYPYYLPPALEAKLISISPATIDRLMRPMRARFNKQGLATTKPGTLLKKHIPIKTNQWDETQPGFIEADTLAHCGTSTAGMFVYTINCVDIATGWHIQRAVWGKGQRGVLQAIESMQQALPFPIRGFDCDNGSEFLNWHLLRHFSKQKPPVQFTRSRPYHKNDNAHIEEKNWTILRQYLGYARFDKPQLTEMLNQLYQSQWYDYFNFFIPSSKLLSKQRQGAQIKKKYDPPQTPFQRLMASPHIPKKQKRQLKAYFETLNPLKLQEEMTQKIKTIIDFANQNSESTVDSEERITTHEKEKMLS